MEENIPDGDLDHMRNILKDLFEKRNVPKRLDIQHHYIIGKVLLTIKNQANSTQQFLEHAKTNVGFSKLFLYFLIDFAVLCMEYPKLKTVSIPIRSIQRYFAYIKQAVKNDAVFWKWWLNYQLLLDIAGLGKDRDVLLMIILHIDSIWLDNNIVSLKWWLISPAPQD